MRRKGPAVHSAEGALPRKDVRPNGSHLAMSKFFDLIIRGFSLTLRQNTWSYDGLTAPQHELCNCVHVGEPVATNNWSRLGTKRGMSDQHSGASVGPEADGRSIRVLTRMASLYVRFLGS